MNGKHVGKCYGKLKDRRTLGYTQKSFGQGNDDYCNDGSTDITVYEATFSVIATA